MLDPGNVRLILHQFSNLLQSISLRVEVLSERQIDDPVCSRVVETLVERTQVFNRTIERLRILAKPLELEFGSVDLKALLKSVCNEIASVRDVAPVATQIEASSGNCNVNGDAYWLHLAFREVMANAHAAALSSDNPEIHIRIGEMDEFWRVAIADSGGGLPNDSLSGELFRSSKPDSGAGLGLPLALHIFSAHQGRVSLEHGSCPGLGLVMLLPRV